MGSCITVSVVERSTREAMSGAFEVTSGGLALHSRLTVKGHGKCETRLERQRVLTKLRRVVAAQRTFEDHDGSS